MTEEDAIEMLKVLEQSGDTEAAHSDADKVLCDFLHELGYTALVKQYNKIEKWYA